jgi:hypothetical protein
MFLLKLKPVRRTIQTTDDGGLISSGGIQNGDSDTTHTVAVKHLQYTQEIYFLNMFNSLRDFQQMLRDKDH